MTQRNMAVGVNNNARPNWAGDFLGREQLLPGGARLDASQFVAYPGPVTVRVGAAAAAAAAVADAGNTGNGTIGALTGRTGARTQTITLTATDATHFTVTGSVSGALGVATSGVAFTSSQVNFTHTAGITPHIAGDKFTIALTQSAVAIAVGAVTIPVGALSAAIPAGTSLNFGAPGRFAVLATTAAAAAESLTVLPLDQAIPAQSTAVFAGSPRKIVPDGTVLGRTYAERNAGTGFGPAAAGDDEVFIMANTVVDADVNDEVNLVRHHSGVLVYENFLPGWQSLANAVQVFVRTQYVSTLGAE
jgi:hypothetical protein